MAFRAPRYSHVHAARAVGVAAITLSQIEDPLFPADNLIDDRSSTLFKFNAASGGPNIIIDLGAGFDTGLDRLIIPADHNLTNIRVWQDTAVDFPSATALASAAAQTPGTLIDYTFTASSEQFIKLSISGASTVWEIPQVVFTKIIFGDSTSPGPNLADSLDGRQDNTTTLEQATGLRPSINHGPQQRVIEYTYESPLEGADLTAMEAFIANVGTHRPFYVDPASFSTPPETDEPALAMKFSQMPESRNSILVPSNNARSKTYRLPLIESLD